eukprot:815609-Rhodomonas_salina.1
MSEWRVSLVLRCGKAAAPTEEVSDKVRALLVAGCAVVAPVAVCALWFPVAVFCGWGCLSPSLPPFLPAVLSLHLPRSPPASTALSSCPPTFWTLGAWVGPPSSVLVVAAHGRVRWCSASAQPSVSVPDSEPERDL